MRVALYARVSSEKQAEKDLSIGAQLKSLRDYAHKRGWEICREFIDEAESARTANRPAFKEMISLAKSKHKPFDAILVWKLSRFARNREDSIIYKSLLRRRGISVISINEQIDDTPAGKLLEGIIEVIDEFYSTNLAQDTLRGMKENAGRGYWSGGTAPVGYKIEHIKDGPVERSKLALDEPFASIVKRIFQLYLNGNGVKEIARTLNEEGLRTRKGRRWTKNHILYILRNENYTGTLVFNELRKHNGKLQRKPNEEIVRVENAHPSIVSKDVFKRAQKIIEKRRPPGCKAPRSLTSQYLLGGFIYCGKCGSSMQGGPAKSGKFHYYTCYNKLRKGTCDARMVNKEKLEKFVIEKLKSRILTEENLAELVRLTNEELLASQHESAERLGVVDMQTKALKQRLDKLYDALETGKIELEDLAPRIRSLRENIEELEQQRNEIEANLRAEEIKFLSKNEIREYVEDLRELLSHGTIAEQKSFLRSFIKRVEVDFPKVVIEYTIPYNCNGVGPLASDVLSLTPTGEPGLSIQM